MKKKTVKGKKKSAKVGDRSGDIAVPKSLDGLKMRDVAVVVALRLKDAGYAPILTGSSCAAIYASAVKAKAIEFVVEEFPVDEMEALMKKMGFQTTELRTFAHKTCPYEVVFVAPPLVVGDAAVEEVHKMQTKFGELQMLKPTDCVRQRLSMYYHWGDRNAFNEAVAVARRRKIDMDLVRRWSNWEWCGDRYEEFLSALQPQ